MKRICLRFILTLAACCFVNGSFAQAFLEDPNWGNNPDERKENVVAFNYLRDAYSAKNYAEAIGYLQSLLEKAPRGTEAIYVLGINIYKNKAARATSVGERNMFADSIVMLYNRRIELFADTPTERGDILTQKAAAYREYKGSDREGILRYFKEAVDAYGDEAGADIINNYFSELTEDYKAKIVETDYFLSEYERLEKLMKSPKNIADTEGTNTFDAIFVTSGAADCESIEKLFAPRLAENPSDKELIDRTIALLNRGNCRGDFYMKVAEMYYKLEPSSNAALVLAAGYEEKKEFAKALEYLNAAMASETDPVLKANLAVRIATSELGLGNAKRAADYSKQAIAINPENGWGHYTLAQAYAAGASGCKDFDRSSIYWLVYDALVTARRLMSGNEIQISGIDQQMNTYRNNFPTRDETFFRGHPEGETITVNCGWITGRTTVRTR